MTMLTADEIKAAAAALDRAERSRKQIGLLSLKHPDATMDDAYAIQDAWVKHKRAAGRKAIGWKIGLTSKAMQYALNISTPDSGVLFDDMLFEDGATIPGDRFIQPRIEAEIAFVMKAPLKGPDVSIFDVLNATDYVTPALEILDTRVLRVDPETRKARTIVDTIADNASSGGFVLGSSPRLLRQLDLRLCGMVLEVNGQVQSSGAGRACFGNPLNAARWLADMMVAKGRPLQAGDIILTGALGPMATVRSGHAVDVRISGLGDVSVRFGEGARA